MPKSGRRRALTFLTGIACISILGAAAYLYHGFQIVMKNPYPAESYQPARDARSPRPTTNENQRIKSYEPNCQRPQTHLDADLCAQWSAVKAVNETNRLTRLALSLAALGFVFAVFGSLTGLVGTALVWFAWQETRTANRIARRDYGKARIEAKLAARESAETLHEARRSADASANLSKVAAENGQRELRAYVDIENITLRQEPGRSSGNHVCISIKLSMKNFGRTPADNVRLEINKLVVENGKQLTDEQADSIREGLGSINPSDSMGGIDYFHISKDIWNKIKSSKMKLHFKVSVQYRDAFRKSRRMAGVYEYETDSPELGFLPGTRENK